MQNNLRNSMTKNICKCNTITEGYIVLMPIPKIIS